jgi:hypothetical protein
MQIQRSDRCQSTTSLLVALLSFHLPFLVEAHEGSWGSAIDDPEEALTTSSEEGNELAETSPYPFDTSYLLDPQHMAPYSDKNKCYASALAWILSALPKTSLDAVFSERLSLLAPNEPHLLRAAKALQDTRHLNLKPSQKELRSFLLTWVHPNIDLVATSASLEVETDPESQNDPASFLTHLYHKKPAIFHTAFGIETLPNKDIDLFFLELLPVSPGLSFLQSIEEGFTPGWEPPEYRSHYLLSLNYQEPLVRSLYFGRNFSLKPHLLRDDGKKGSQHHCELLAITLYQGDGTSGHHFAMIKTPSGWLHTDTLETEREICLKQVCPKLLLVKWQGAIANI